MTKTIKLENERYAIEIETGHGIVRRLVDREAGFELISEPRLAENFRLLLPLPGYACNYLLGTEQKLTACDRTATGVKLFWQGPLKNARGDFDLDVTLWIELVEQSVTFKCEVQNRTEHKLTEVWYAFVAGMMGLGNDPAERRETEILIPICNAWWSQKLFSNFGGWYGVGTCNVEHKWAYPSVFGLGMPWISLFNPKTDRGLYFAALEESPRAKLIRFALDPGAATRRPSGDWPRPEETGDLPTGLTMNWVHLPYTKPGETFVSSSVVLQCHSGGWRESGAIFRKWFDSRFRALPAGSTWIRRETATLDTMFLLPEDNINLTFRDIPAWARSAKRYGIGHVMISGWHIGGHDRGYPYYEPDPRLGTYDDLRAGIRTCHELGLKVSFFVNCRPADITTDWYKKELSEYRILNPYGEPYEFGICGMGTLSARYHRGTAVPWVEINTIHAPFREALLRYFKKLIEIGADGLHLDKFAVSSPLDFNPKITGTSPDRAVTEPALQFIEELLAVGRAINPEFCISWEGGWDRMMPYSETSWWGGADAMKSVFPQRVLTEGVEQPYDFNRVNQAVLMGANLLVGPANYTRGMDYAPMKKLFEYIGEITRIRQELLDIVSLGDLLDCSEGIFKADKPQASVSGAFAKSKDARWSVFRDPNSGRRALVLANFGAAPLRAQALRLAGGRAQPCRIHQAFTEPRESRWPASVLVPGEQVVFVCEGEPPV